MLYWYVALGGAVGSVVRVALSDALNRRWEGWPLGTLLVNVVGSFLIGLLAEVALAPSVLSREIRVLLTAGFCGGFTTFSAFSLESTRLLQAGDLRRASLYIGLSLLLCIGGTMGGLAAGHALSGSR